MHIEQATLSDLDDLSPLFAAYLHFYGVEKSTQQVSDFLHDRLLQGQSIIFIARDVSTKALGFVQLYKFFASLHLAPALLLSDLYVASHARRQGVGEGLMNAARNYGESTGVCGLQLETAKDNTAGQALYERLGYCRDNAFYTYWLGLPARANS